MIVLFSGDGGPQFRLPDVTVFSLGRALEALDVETVEWDEPNSGELAQ